MESKTLTIQRVAGSFRDPSGFVFWYEGRLFRAVDKICHQVLSRLTAVRRLDDLVQKGLIVDTKLVGDGPLLNRLRGECPEVDHFLEHEVVPSITYPYEWTTSMLAEAALHTIDLQIELLHDGLSLKDATPYNIQFCNGRPCMIDLSSIERPPRLDVWFALGQFLQMFFYPLVLCHYRGWDLRSYFLASINGREIEHVARSFSLTERLRPSLFFDLTLPLWLHRWSEGRSRSHREELHQPKTNCQAQIFNLKRLHRKIRKMAARHQSKSAWAKYTSICNYDEQAEQAKESLVRAFLEQTAPRRVMDLGCNTGQYSYLAAGCGAEVIALDGDHDAVDVFYRRLRDEPAAITPMVIDLANPSPAIGYQNVERPSFLQRFDADCVMALALMHHLLVSANMSLQAVRDLLHSLTKRDVVLEFVPTDDDMFQRLLNYRVDLFQGLTLDTCRTVFAEKFDFVQETPIDHSKRTLFLLRKK